MSSRSIASNWMRSFGLATQAVFGVDDFQPKTVT